MGEIHNLQAIIAQSPILTRLNEGLHYGAFNGAQILTVIEERKNNKKLSTVNELKESAATEKEDPRKRRLKKNAEERLIDVMA